ALDLARRTIDAFETARADAVIVNTSGCGAHMKAYGHLLAADPAYAERATRFAASVRDLAEFLAGEPLRGPLSPVPITVTYHDPCHVVHGQKIRNEPRRLLAQIPGLQVVGSTIVRDEPVDVQRVVRETCADGRVQAVIVTGGTGITSRDSTFEAIEALLDKRLPGFGELFRMLSYAEIGAAAMLSRAQL